jgi:prolyl 4-hydroxylase
MQTAATIAAHAGVQRVPSPKLNLFIRKRFLDEAECAEIIGLIDEKRRPSTIADDLGDPTFRTSETCDLDGTHPAVAALDAKIIALTGLDPAHGEPIQGQRYAVGQEFKAHTDYFEPGGADYPIYCSVAGNRTWTVMIYLNDVGAGGATRFTTIGKTVQPELGKLLAWDNCLADGSVNPNTMHHGMKVRAGVKYIVTKWFRERPWG